MSELRTLPPVVEKVWITVDYRRKSVVNKFFFLVFLKLKGRVGYVADFYAQLDLVYPHLFNSETRL